jgi:hypothetical protein
MGVLGICEGAGEVGCGWIELDAVGCSWMLLPGMNGLSGLRLFVLYVL